MSYLQVKVVSTKLVYAIVLALLLNVVAPLYSSWTHAQSADYRSIMLDDDNPGDITSFKLGFTITTPGTLGSIKLEFCDNSPIIGDTCNAPAGFNISGATVTTQTGETGFNIDAMTTANMLVLSRSPTATLGGPVTYEVANVHNQTSTGTSYARITTYASSDTTGPILDSGGLAYALVPTFTVTTEVPPYIDMCVGLSVTGTDCTTVAGDYLNLGDFSPTHASSGTTQLVVSTNADNGYSITLSGHTMTAGNHIIPSLSSLSPSRPGTSQFGINLRQNAGLGIGDDPTGVGHGQPTANYNSPDLFTYNDGDVIASYIDAEAPRKYTVTFLVNVDKNQSPGIYTSTFTYIGLGNF